MLSLTEIENRLLGLTAHEIQHLPDLAVNTESFRCYHIRLEKVDSYYNIGFRFIDYPAQGNTFFAFLPGSLSIPRRAPLLDGNYLKWIGYDHVRRKPFRLFFVQENFDTLFQILDNRLKPGLRQFLLGSYGHQNAERNLPRTTRTYEKRNNAVRRFFDHFMFEAQLLPLIRDFVYDR